MEEFEKDLKEIKDKLNEYQLSDEFKEKLQKIMDEKYYETNESYDNKNNIKTKIIKFPSSIVAAVACFFFLISGYVTFADEFENLVTKIFANTDKKIEMAVANGNYKEINMDYVENNGIGIKVDYVIVEEDTLCIALNVKTEFECDNIYIYDVNIYSGGGNRNYESNFGNTNLKCNTKSLKKILNKNNYMFFYKIEGKEKTNFEEDIEIKIIDINYEDNKEMKTIKGEWKLHI